MTIYNNLYFEVFDKIKCQTTFFASRNDFPEKCNFQMRLIYLN